MKTLFKTFAYAAISALALSSCAKEKLQPADELTGKLVTVHFGTENTDPSTKATLTPDAGETAFQAAWENEDQILISYSYNYGNPSTTTGRWKDNSFEANLTGGKGVWIYDAAYPVPAENNSVDFGSNRTQKGNAYNSKYDIMIGSAVAEGADAGKDAQGNDIIFEMNRQTAIAYFHFTSELDESLVSATLKVKDGAIANSAASISELFKFVAEEANDLTEINLTFEKGTAPSAKDFQLWFNVLPTSYSSMTLTVETATKTFTISKSTDEPGSYEAGKLYKVNKSGISWTDKIFFYESFDQTSGTGGNDNAWSGSIASNNVVYDNEEWDVSNAGGASKCLKLGTGSKKGTATTPSLGITTSEATLSFKAAAWNASNEKTTIKLSIIGAGTISPTSVNLAKGQWSEYDCTITGADATTKIKFEAANAADNRFFIDEVYVYSGTRPVVLPKLESPANLQCSTKTETSLTFSWDAVDNASGYKVSTDGGSTYGDPQTETSYTWTGLTAGSSYTLYVKAIGDGTNFTDSDAAYASATTIAGSGSGAKTTTLSNANITAVANPDGTQTTGYRELTYTDDNGFQYSAYAIQTFHSKDTKDNCYIQIKKYSSNTAYYVKLPQFTGNIKSIHLVVSGSSKPMSGSGNTATIFFSASNSTSEAGDNIVSGSGNSEITIDASSLNLNTGYLTSNGAVRIWEIKVEYYN